MDKKARNIFLFSILLLAAILRLIHPFQIPFTYDEVTALIRTHYSSLSEEIRQGVMLHDNHPAGVQLFIYYWTMLFGYTAIVVKLPFLAFGILAVYFTYKVGNDWFNNTVGLVCAAYMATLQYPIMYSQEIRPYVSGLFVAIAMVYYWNKVIFKPEAGFYKNASLYVLFSALCAYDHHFCLLFAVIVGITGLFFIQKKHLLKYVIAGISIFVLYIPHLHIFFYQLSQGGVGGPNGWLGAPRNTFILEYIHYIFHFSRSVMLVAITICVFGIYSAFSKGFTHKKYLIISLCWFLIPLLTGFFYSLYVNPVLQYSVLIFSFPFLLFFIFGCLPELKARELIVFLSLVCFINTFSLVNARKHYQLFYKAAYEQPILINDSLVKALGKENYGCIIQSDDSDKNVSYYYIHKDHADTSFYFTDNLGCFTTKPSNYCRITDFISQQNKTYFAFGCTAQFDPIVLSIITHKYPYLVKKWDFAGGSFYLLTNKQIKDGATLHSFESVNGFDGRDTYWEKSNPVFVCDTLKFSVHNSYEMDAQHEWAPNFSCSLSNMSWGKNDIIEVSIKLYPMDTLKDVMLVSSLESDGKAIDWRAIQVSSFIRDTVRKTWVTAYHTLKLQDLKINYPNLILKVYIWNKGKKQFYMNDFSVKTIKGNPVIYGLFEKI